MEISAPRSGTDDTFDGRTAPGPETPVTVAVVGVGALGLPMARRLAHAGFDVTGIEPFIENRRRAEESGIQCVEEIAAADNHDVVLVLVATGQQVKDVVEQAIRRPTGVHGETWIVVSTIGPKDARTAYDALTRAGAVVVDAPVTGGVPGAERGQLRFFAAGPQAVVDAHERLWSVLGTVLYVGEQVGDGQSMKLVNQLCSSTHLVVAAEAVALAQSLGLDPLKAVELISGGSGASWFFDDRGARMAAGTDEVLTRLAILAKDSALVEAQAAEAGASVPMLQAARRQYLKAHGMDLLESDDSQIVRTYITPSPATVGSASSSSAK
ncbi:3-hydroxyisobutyrate dehydrogenase [Rhodococcus rhodochrous J45]|uniref:3-hydroxyisobutyrate dehydrogenase n=1 Tax=Rhodococcus rhodochrous J45 TaxID=935266 RepID=A0A562DMQ2_RHORH|nr:NAD(P)-dependent oxidoreductase [Rhodococcus rhodochrous]TWH10895.1 3-hydroxyisobutyrate dehydrogenase [Rhodococcus rhodochrous J45]